MVGDNAMAAVSVSYPFTLANSGISTLIGIGSASILSRAIGKRDQSTIDKIMGNLIAMNLIFSLIIMAIGMIFTKQILMLSGASGEILELALRYLRIIFAGSLFVNFAQSSNMIMRGEGLLKQAMLFSASSAIMNIILDPIFILLLKPYGMGIDGAAYATVASQVAYAMASLWYFKRKSKNVRINAIRIEKTLFSEIIGVGFSAMLMQMMMLVQQTALYNLAAQHGGDTWQIILGATYRVVSFAFIPLWGLSQGYQPAVGTNYGAKQYDRVKHITKVFAITATLLALIFYLPIMLVPKTILSMFITTPSVVELGVGDFRLFFLSYILLGVWIVVLTLMQSLGRATKASVLVILRQIAIYIPVAIIMPYIMGFGVHGVFAAPLITDMAVFIVAAGMMLTEFRRMDVLKSIGR
jgi:putative MATE family efflux protein